MMTKVTAEEFHQRIHDNHMYGLWELASQMTVHPMPEMRAWMWKWWLLDSINQAVGGGDPRWGRAAGAAALQPRHGRAVGDDKHPHRRDPAAAAGRGGAGAPAHADGDPLHPRRERLPIPLSRGSGYTWKPGTWC